MRSDVVEPEPALELSFSPEWLQDAAPDASAWQVGELSGELEDGESVVVEYGVPIVDDEDVVVIPAWNLGGSALRRVAAAAAFVPLLSIAEPAFAAPPTTVSVIGPSLPPAPDPSVWDGLVDKRVVLSMKDGLNFRGTVLSVNNGVLVCAREIDGLMVLVDAAQILSVHVEGLPGTPAPKKAQTGQGLIVLGSILTSVGTGMALATLAAGGICIDTAADDPYGYGYGCWYTIPFGVSSLVTLSVGIPFIVTGLRKRTHHRTAMREAGAPEVTAFVNPGHHGVTAGVGMRF